jgi:RNA polymerase sigma-70 factor (ECF subfamily)
VVAGNLGEQTGRMAKDLEAGALTFDAVVAPHLVAAYRLACWLLRNEHDAEDVVQEASLRAFRYFRTFSGGDGRAWFLRIVRHTCYDWRRHHRHPLADAFDEEQHSCRRPQPTPEALLLRTDGTALIGRAMSSLPKRLQRVLVLREVEGLSYQELADATGIPLGTVMSRLSRARTALRRAHASGLAASLGTRGDVPMV